MKYSQLEKNCKKPTDSLTERASLAVLGNCATQHLATALRGWAYEEGIALDVFDADYNQIDAQVMDDNSELYQFHPEYTLIFLCSEKLYEEFCGYPLERRASFADDKIRTIEQYWAAVREHMSTHILQMNFIERDDRVFGNFSNKTQDSFLYQIRKMNFLLMEKCQQHKDVFVVDIEQLAHVYGDSFMRDEKLYYIAKMPISTHALPEAAREVVDVIKAIRGKIKKCLILDLDNTIWGGGIGGRRHRKYSDRRAGLGARVFRASVMGEGA